MCACVWVCVCRSAFICGGKLLSDSMKFILQLISGNTVKWTLILLFDIYVKQFGKKIRGRNHPILVWPKWELCSYSWQCVKHIPCVGLWQSCPLLLILFVIFIERISRQIKGLESVQFTDLKTLSLLFADDVILLASSSCDLKHALNRFVCEAGGMRISHHGSLLENVDCALVVGTELLPQEKAFK